MSPGKGARPNAGKVDRNLASKELPLFVTVVNFWRYFGLKQFGISRDLFVVEHLCFDILLFEYFSELKCLKPGADWTVPKLLWNINEPR